MFQLLEIFYIKQFYNYVYNLQNFKQDFVLCHRLSGVPSLLLGLHSCLHLLPANNYR